MKREKKIIPSRMYIAAVNSQQTRRNKSDFLAVFRTGKCYLNNEILRGKRGKLNFAIFHLSRRENGGMNEKRNFSSKEKKVNKNFAACTRMYYIETDG